MIESLPLWNTSALRTTIVVVKITLRIHYSIWLLLQTQISKTSVGNRAWVSSCMYTVKYNQPPWINLICGWTKARTPTSQKYGGHLVTITVNFVNMLTVVSRYPQASFRVFSLKFSRQPDHLNMKGNILAFPSILTDHISIILRLLNVRMECM